MSVDVITTAADAMVNSSAPTTVTGSSIPDHLHFINSAIIGPILCFPGMIANIISIFVWNQPSMKSSTGRYLSGQAVADFFVLFFFIVCDSAKEWNPDLATYPSYGVFFSYIGYPFFFLAIICSIWFTVGVTIDRYVMVCWITKAKQMCTEKRANFGLFLITVNCFIVNVPHFFSYAPTTGDANATDAMALTEFGGGPGGKFYEFWIHCIILILIPWFSVLFMNVKIIQQIMESNKRMASKKSNQSIKKCKDSQTQVTRILLCVTFSFLFFIGIQCVVQCLWMQEPPNANWDMVSSSFAFAKTGIVFNSSLNFVFYCLTGRRFRTELMSMLGLSSKDSMASSFVNTPSTGTSTNPSSSTTGM